MVHLKALGVTGGAILGLCLCTASSLQSTPEATLLAEGGRSRYSLFVPADAAPAVQLAGEELAAGLERMSHSQFQVQRGGRPPKRSIILECPPAAKPGEDRGEGYTIALEAEQIRIRGERPRAVLFAVYDLLERLGCRFLSPTFAFFADGATVVSQHDRLVLKLPAAIRSRPALAHRKLYVEEGISHSPETLQAIAAWMPKARYNTLVIPTDYQGRGKVRWDNWRRRLTPHLERRDLVIEVGGHGYQNFLNAEADGGKWFREHPEWFGQDAAGVRQKARSRVFCTSQASARRFVIDRYLEYVTQRPEIRTFDFWPPDGARWCECAVCAAMGSPSERQAQLVNEVRQATARVRPDLRLEVLAYSTSVTPPEDTELDRRILLDFCPIAQSFEKQIYESTTGPNATYAAGLTAWRKAFDGEISVYTYYRKYAWRSLPVVIPHYIQKDLRWYQQLPVQGVSTYAEPGDWGAYELNHYALGRLAWDPGIKVDGLVNDFCRARYGTLAGPARELLLSMGEALRTHGSIPGTTLKAAEAVATVRQRLQRTRDAFIASAKSSIATLEHAELSVGNIDQHLGAPQRLILMADYALRDLEIQELRARKAAPTELKSRIASLSAFLSGPDGRTPVQLLPEQSPVKWMELAQQVAAQLRTYPGAGVFLVHSRFEVPRLLRSYGLSAR